MVMSVSLIRFHANFIQFQKSKKETGPQCARPASLLWGKYWKDTVTERNVVLTAQKDTATARNDVLSARTDVLTARIGELTA